VRKLTLEQLRKRFNRPLKPFPTLGAEQRRCARLRAKQEAMLAAAGKSLGETAASR
jgi:hypothetical protein